MQEPSRAVTCTSRAGLLRVLRPLLCVEEGSKKTGGKISTDLEGEIAREQPSLKYVGKKEPAMQIDCRWRVSAFWDEVEGVSS